MKKLFIPVTAAVFVAIAVVLASAKPADVMTKENGTYVVNTTTLGSKVEGYAGPTPLKIYIKKNKVEKIEVLKNEETPKYLNVVKKKLLDKWNGLTVKNAASTKIDGVTGATFTSKAIKENVRLGLEYYQKNK
jgi:electron transport complex protein RnfG